MVYLLLDSNLIALLDIHVALLLYMFSPFLIEDGSTNLFSVIFFHCWIMVILVVLFKNGLNLADVNEELKIPYCEHYQCNQVEILFA